jgi:predicted nucleotidyltransferase
MSRSFSGKFVVRIPGSVHAQLHADSKALGISLNQLCQQKLLQESDSHSIFSDAIALARSIAGKDFIGCILFGSYARQTYRSSSDVDIMIVVRESFQARRKDIQRWDDANIVIDQLPTSVSFARIPQDDVPSNVLWLEAAIDGKVLSDPTNVVHTTLSRLRRAIADNLISRRYSHGHSYWVKGQEHV